ncbi:MAG: dTDP-4-dehydrorhamnose reductase [Rhodospirillales bacterium]|nr:dTDP-4-dehydrorhamnose reductase [Rhodospirillales bacterium]
MTQVGTGRGPILVTGGSGQLAAAIMALAGGRNLVRAGRPEFDFDRPDELPALLARLAPSLVVNAAAYTAVDRAEADAEAAARANTEGPATLARYCAQAGIPLIHVSTDYVFDGDKGAPYVEEDAPNPTGVYGATKLAGERAVLAACPRAIVLRTSWVYGATGRNFVLTMLNAARKTDRLRVVADQIGCPTATQDLAAAILAIADRLAAEGWKPEFAGVFHAAGSGWTSWHGLAEAVFQAAARHGGPQPVVEAIATADWPTPVRRPPDSRLDCGRLARVFGLRLPDWRHSVAVTVDAVFCDDPIPLHSALTV